MKIQKVFPSKIYENSGGFLSTSYGDFVSMFVEVIKDLNQRIEKLEQTTPNIKTITSRVEEMEAFLKN